jgi:hypothetical protein
MAPQSMAFIKKVQMQKQRTETYSSNVWGVRMLQQIVHLLDSKLHGEELVEETECSGGASAIASHPRFYMIDFIVDLVNDLMIGLQPVEPLKVIR